MTVDREHTDSQVRCGIKIHCLCYLVGLAFVLLGCKPAGGGGGTIATNLSVMVWSAFPPPTNSYRHFDHLQTLLRTANTLIATNPAVFSQAQAHGELAQDSPLRSLLGIPAKQPAYLTWSQSMTQRRVTVRSSTTEQRFGEIRVNLQTGRIDSAQDLESLLLISEMERRLRQTVGTREEALRLFHGGLKDAPSLEQEQAARLVAAALFLPAGQKCQIRMSAPGGSNRGVGYLTVGMLSSSNSFEHIALVTYPARHGLFSGLGLASPSYEFGGLRLSPSWTNLNTEGFLIDSDGFPYPHAGGLQKDSP